MLEQRLNKPRADVSVVISTLDRPYALARCLDSLIAGDVLPNEIVVVDQSHDDHTLAVVTKHQATMPMLHYIHHAGRGLGTSQNIGFRAAKFPTVAVLDDDCLADIAWLGQIEKALAPSSGIDVITGRVLPLGPDVPGTYAVSTRTHMVQIEFDRRAMPWDLGSGNNFAARRDWLLRIGGNDERLGPGSPGQGGVDMDLFYRLLRTGACIHYDPHVLVYHERVNRMQRLRRRVPYGHGMGAACALWLCSGDRNALRVLWAWLLMRLWRMAGALRKRNWQLVYEEVLVLTGTVLGLVYGLRSRTSNMIS